MDAERNWTQGASILHLCVTYGIKSFVEVGVFKAETTKAVLFDPACPIEHYWLVDPWSPYIDQQDFVGMGVRTSPEFEAIYRKVAEDMAVYGERVQIIRKASLAAAPMFADASLDCVFIDGNHRRECVEADIDAWFPKVRSGGVVAGHDYNVLKDINDAVLSRFSEDKLLFLPDNQFAKHVPKRSLENGWEKAIWYYVKP